MMGGLDVKAPNQGDTYSQSGHTIQTDDQSLNRSCFRAWGVLQGSCGRQNDRSTTSQKMRHPIHSGASSIPHNTSTMMIDSAKCQNDVHHEALWSCPYENCLDPIQYCVFVTELNQEDTVDKVVVAKKAVPSKCTVGIL